jgi:hypothetical protein
VNAHISPEGFPPTDLQLRLRRFIEAGGTPDAPVSARTLRASWGGLPLEQARYADRVRQLVAWGALGCADSTDNNPAFWVEPSSPLVAAILADDVFSNAAVERVVMRAWNGNGVTRSSLSAVSPDPSTVNAALELLVDARALRITSRASERMNRLASVASSGRVTSSRTASSRAAVPLDFCFVATLTGYGEHLVHLFGAEAAA